jgi:hypothetical protein
MGLVAGAQAAPNRTLTKECGRSWTFELCLTGTNALQ